MWRFVRFWVGTALAIPVVLAGCGGGGDDEQVVVFAAASLTGAFDAIADSFEESHPGVDVVVNAAASSELATQIIEGAPADVFASADPANMARVDAADGVVGEPSVFATNRTEIMVAPDNPLAISEVADLTDPELVVVTCAPEVPCGRYAAEVFTRAGVVVVPDSYETSVRSVVTKVTLGEADAGIVYATDVLAAGDDASGVAIPDDINVIAAYPVAVLAEADHPALARDFVDHLEGETARSALAELGFTAP